MVNWLHKAYWNAFTLWHARAEAWLPYRPLEEILTAQNQHVRAIIKHAYETVSYYREVMDKAGLHTTDFHTAEDLARLPILTSEQVAGTPERFLSHRYATSHHLKIQSSGTSGRAKCIYYDPAALFLSLAHGHRQRSVLAQFVGRQFGYREMSAIRSESVNLQIRNFYASHSWIPRKIDLTRDILSPKNTFEENIARLNTFRPEVILGYGSYIGALFRWAREHHHPVFCPSVVVYGAEGIPDPDRLLIENEFGVPVLSTYQAVEALRIAFQCERRAGFHLSLDDVAVRVVNEQGKTLGPGGTGHLIISNLTNRATVLLNYKLGDVVTLSSSACACGRTLPTIEQIVGRSDDLLVLPEGQVAHALAVLEDLRAVPGVVQVQVLQEDLRRFILRVVCATAIDWRQTRQRLDAALRRTLGNNISLEIQRLDVIPPEPGGKVRAVISRCHSSTLSTGTPTQ
jgi:phenylacetate-coenzyme A ligase PaaK-like adenylate-forming protein